VSEGRAAPDGRRRSRYIDALGSARETLANLEVAEAVGYIEPISPELRNRFNHIIGTLVRNIY
jgi:hypothetical protein